MMPLNIVVEMDCCLLENQQRFEWDDKAKQKKNKLRKIHR